MTVPTPAPFDMVDDVFELYGDNSKPIGCEYSVELLHVVPTPQGNQERQNIHNGPISKQEKKENCSI